MRPPQDAFHVAQFEPKGDQIQAIEQLVKGLKDGEEFHLTQHQAVHVPPGFFYQLNNKNIQYFPVNILNLNLYSFC